MVFKWGVLSLWLLSVVGLVSCAQTPLKSTEANDGHLPETPKTPQTYPLTSTQWQLGAFYEGNVAASGKVTLTLNSANKQISGFGGCNHFFGQFQRAQDSLNFYQMGATRKLCKDMSEEDLFFKFMMRTNRFVIDGNRLTLFRGQRPMMQFSAVGAPPKETVVNTAHISGTVLLSESKPLPDNQTLTVVLEDISQTPQLANEIARWETPTKDLTTPAPWPFRLAYVPDHLKVGHRYRLRGYIKEPESERYSWLSTQNYPFIPDLTDAITIELKPTAKAVKTFERAHQYLCDTTKIDVLFIGQKAMKLSAPQGKWILQKVSSASGQKYENAQITFWIKNDEAILEMKGERAKTCTAIQDNDAMPPKKSNGLNSLFDF